MLHIRVGMPNKRSSDEVIVEEPTVHPPILQNRFPTYWVDFVAEHVDVDRPGDR
jgi:hypothetical protein